MKDYKVEITGSSKELTARDKIKLKDLTNAKRLDDMTQAGAVVIKPESYVTLHIINPASENKEYDITMVLDENGDKYITGSESFYTSFMDIWDELVIDAGETDFEISVYRVDSKNYKGKQFITCSLI